MDKKRVLFISQEITPYLCETEISTRCRNLPQGIMEKGKDIRIFMPKYGCINERRNQLHEVIRLSGMNMILDNLDYPLIIKVASLEPIRMQVYFIENEDYFPKKTFMHELDGEEFEFHDERAIFFSGVHFGRSPMIAIRAHPVKPRVVIYIKPKAIDKPVKTVSIGLDGTCMLLCKDGYRQAMVGSVSLYDKKDRVFPSK